MCVELYADILKVLSLSLKSFFYNCQLIIKSVTFRFKGAVMKTRTGGHSVQFTDIESLKHRSEGGVTTTAPSGNDTDGSPHRRG